MAILQTPDLAYQEGTWTPVLTFATPGDLSVTYAQQFGSYTRIGRLVVAGFVVSTSAFTFTTGSGAVRITGLPFTSATGHTVYGTIGWQGITKASYTNPASFLSTASNIIGFVISGSGQAQVALAATDTPTGGSVYLAGTLSFFV